MSCVLIGSYTDANLLKQLSLSPFETTDSFSRLIFCKKSVFFLARVFWMGGTYAAALKSSTY